MGIAETSVIILAGGQGTRIRTLFPDIPKPLIPVCGFPFIEWVIKYFLSQGFRKFIISLGHLGDIAEAYFRERETREFSFVTIRESEPLGTGGALLFARERFHEGDYVVVTNGDSLALVDIASNWMILDDKTIDGFMFGIPILDTSRYGSLEIDEKYFLRGFNEKRKGSGLINAGIYVFHQRLFTLFPMNKPLSLEQDVFPALLASGARIRVCLSKAPLIDIGTPESFAQADRFIKQFMVEVANDYNQNTI